MMTRTIRAALIVAALLLTVPPLPAQPPGDRVEPTPDQRTRDASAPPPAPAATPAERDEADAATASSPFDYEASEEISEDLSVSFPVDI